MITYRSIYNRKRKLRANGTAVVQIEAYKDRSRKFFTTGIYLKPQYWDFEKERVKPTHPDHYTLNTLINNKINELKEVEKKMVLEGQEITIETFAQNMKRIECEKLVSFMRIQLDNHLDLKDRTLTDLENTIRKIEAYNPNVNIQNVDYNFIKGFDTFLKKEGLAINTIAKQHKNLKRFLNEAIKMKIIGQENYPYHHFKVKYENKEREVLMYEEIQRLESLDLSNKLDYKLVLDMFLFSCYTGLRISDVRGLKPEHVKLTQEGYELDFAAFKTGKRVQLPLYMLFPSSTDLTKPEKIIDRYLPGSKKNVFPIHSESYINTRLKGLGEMAEIQKRMYFHMARHSFGTYMAGKIPLPTLQELMQHSDIKTTMIYVNMSKKIINDGLKNVQW